MENLSNKARQAYLCNRYCDRFGVKKKNRKYVSAVLEYAGAENRVPTYEEAVDYVRDIYDIGPFAWFFLQFTLIPMIKHLLDYLSNL